MMELTAMLLMLSPFRLLSVWDPCN